MKKLKIAVLAILSLEIALGAFVSLKLAKNETFFTGEYKINEEQSVQVPRYSYFKDIDGHVQAKFVSARSQKSLEEEINSYLESYKKISDKSGTHYKKDDLIIQEYKVEDCGLYRRITILY